jgi:Protein of unknown function (DUF2393)
MSPDALKISFLLYINHLGLYDYLAFFWFFLTFLALIALSIIIVKRSTTLSLLLIIMALTFFSAAPFAIKDILNQKTRPTHIETLHTKKLTFSDSFIIEASLTNISKKDFSLCLIQTTLLKKRGEEPLKNYMLALKPIKNQSILLREPLLADEVREVRIVFDDFSYDREVDVTLKSECY